MFGPFDPLTCMQQWWCNTRVEGSWSDARCRYAIHGLLPPAQVLLEGIGWPIADPAAVAQAAFENANNHPEGAPPPRADPAAHRVLAGPGLRSALDEIKAQTLTLQVVRAHLVP